MEKIKVRLTLIEGMLGTSSANKDVYRDFIGSKPPAVSRDDNETELCPMCGATEALEDYFGVGRGGLGNG